MAENGNKNNSIDYNNEEQLNEILSEIDKLIEKENIDRESLFDSFDSDKKEKASNTPPSRKSAEITKTRRAEGNKKNHKRQHISSNPPKSRKSNKTAKSEKTHSHSRENNSKKKNKKGIKVLVVIFILVVFVSAGITTLLYFSGLATPLKDTTTENATQTTVDPHKQLAVITVSDKTITFNGEEITESQLKSKLNKDDNLTLSLVNVGADSQVYNAVATILNNHGGNYELMDDENTNPSINTDNVTTTTPGSGDSEENPANFTESTTLDGENQE